jgi:O-antigen/teichoic acid export membrane protein
MSPLAGSRPIGANTGLLFASQAITSILRAVYAAVLARQLGPQLFGLMNYGLGWYAAFLAIANLQLESYMSRQVALNPANAADVLSRAMTLRAIAGLLVFVAAVSVALGTSSPADGELTAVLVIFAFAMIGRSAAMWCNSVFISTERAGHVFRMEVAFRLVEVLVGIALLLAGSGLVVVAIVHALSWWAQSVYGLLLVRRRVPAVHLRLRWGEQLDLFRAVMPVALASIGATWLMQGPFILFKDVAAVPGDLGMVALILQVFVLVTGVPVALGRAALPALSRTVVRTDNKDALFLGLVLRTAIPATTALVIGAATAGVWLITRVFGEAYLAAGANLAFGMLLALPFGVATLANQILIAHDRTWEAMASALLGAVAMTAFVSFAMPTGGDVATYFLCILAGMAVWSTAALVLLGRHVAVDWQRCLVRPMLAGGLSMALYYMLTDVIGPWGGLILAIGLLIAGQWMFAVVDRQELSLLSQQLLARVGRSRSGR